MAASHPFDGARQSGFEVATAANGDITVKLWGDLGLGWFGRLSTALARRGLNIRSAQANRHAHDRWTGSLELFAPDPASDARSLDYVELTREVAYGNLPAPVLNHHRIERTEAGALKLRIFAADRIGLLAGLFDRLEFLSLFPERLEVTTSGGNVDDTLWLRGVAACSPSLQAEFALRDSMLRLTRADAG